MPERFGQRKHLPFVKLSLHERRDEVVRLRWRIARQAGPEGACGFWTHHLLEDPDDPGRQHQWVDVYFPGAERHTLWNAAFITTQMALDDAISERAFSAAHAQLSPEESEREFAMQWRTLPRTRPGGMRMSEWVRRPDIHYPQFEGRSFRDECERLEAQVRATDPPRVGESFIIDRSYAYGIGLHATVAEANLDRAAIERTILRFRQLGERDWRAAPLA